MDQGGKPITTNQPSYFSVVVCLSTCALQWSGRRSESRLILFKIIVPSRTIIFVIDLLRHVFLPRAEIADVSGALNAWLEWGRHCSILQSIPVVSHVPIMP